MMSDDELIRLREIFFNAGASIAFEADEDTALVWSDVLLEPSPDNLRALLVELRGTIWHGRVLNGIVEIGYAAGGNVLNAVPLPLEMVSDRRWQLRRELSRIVAGMTVGQLQQLVYWARSIAR